LSSFLLLAMRCQWRDIVVLQPQGRESRRNSLGVDDI
jgi:hypothetical protein